MNLQKPMIQNVRPHDGLKPQTFTQAGDRYQADVSMGPSDSPAGDAFGRLRTAAPFTIFDSKLINDNGPLFWDDAATAGAGTSSTYNANQASVSIGVGNLTAGSAYPVLGLRLKPGYLDITINLIGHSILCSTANDQFCWEWVLNGTTSSSLTFADITNSALQVAEGTSTVTLTGGTVIASGYGKSELIATQDVRSHLLLGSTIDGTADRIFLSVVPFAALNVSAAIQWRELV